MAVPMVSRRVTPGTLVTLATPPAPRGGAMPRPTTPTPRAPSGQALRGTRWGTVPSIGDAEARADTAEEAIGPSDSSRDVAPDASYDSSVSFAPVPSDGGPFDAEVLALADARPDTSADATKFAYDAASDTGVADQPKRIVRGVLSETFGQWHRQARAHRSARGSKETLQDSSDCASLSLACVAVNGQPACRQLRCELPPICAPGTFYQEVPLSVKA